MANTLGFYNPVFYANEALVWLRKSLGVAPLVYRGYEGERNAFGRGDTVNIRRPGQFSAQNAPSAAQDLETDEVQISLNQWKEVKFELTDKELAYTAERVIQEHIGPATYALAENIDTYVGNLLLDLGASTTIDPSSDGVKLVTKGRKLMADQKVPMNNAGVLAYVFDPVVEQALLEQAAFTQDQGAGQLGVQSQINGRLGQRYGIGNLVMSQNLPSFTRATTSGLAGGPDADGSYAKGVTSVGYENMSVGATTGFGKYDSFKFDNHDTIYTHTGADQLNSATGTLTLSPPLQTAITTTTEITQVTALAAGTYNMNPMFHRNAVGLVIAPLPSQSGQETGARVFTQTDPETGLSVRARVFYEPNDSAVNVALDVLYGASLLDARLGCRNLDAQ